MTRAHVLSCYQKFLLQKCVSKRSHKYIEHIYVYCNNCIKSSQYTGLTFARPECLCVDVAVVQLSCGAWRAATTGEALGCECLTAECWMLLCWAFARKASRPARPFPRISILLSFPYSSSIFFFSHMLFISANVF
jgi:hypothetical protein